MGLFDCHYFGCTCTFGVGHLTRYNDDIPVPVQGPATPEVKLVEKQQRVAVQTKSHKRKTQHIQQKKDVPAFLKNLVKKV